jgi:4-amino-4-deoxy-L-arabinose transferase-like glycosyltransferase
MSNSQVAENTHNLPCVITVDNSKVFRAPGSGHLERALPALIFAVSTLYLFMFRRYSSIDLDEGIILQGAERVLRGQIPYRDFFMFYTPGSVYLVAGLFKVFGDSFSVARTSIAIVGAVCTVITYLLSRRVASRDIALLMAALTMTTSVTYRFLVIHNWYATLFASLTVYAVVRLWESQRWSWAFAAGSLAAVTTLIEQSKGAGLCLGLFVGYLILLVFGSKEALQGTRLNSLVAGFLWPWIATLLFFGSNHAIRPMLYDWVWPLQHYSRVNHVPYGFQGWSEHVRHDIFLTGPIWVRIAKYVAMSPGFIMPLLPLVAVACLTLGSWRLRRHGIASLLRRESIVLNAALSGLLFSIVRVRADITHFMYLAPLWYVVLAWVLGSRDLRSELLDKVRPSMVTYICVAFGLMVLAILLNLNGAQNRLETRRGTLITGAADTVVDYVQTRVAPGGELLVYPYAPIYNYLTETHSPAPLEFFQAGMNTPDQEQEIIAVLKSKKVHVVLFEPGFADKFATSWPETPLGAVANDAVADFIVRNYRVCSPLVSSPGWLFQFMVRKGDDCD